MVFLWQIPGLLHLLHRSRQIESWDYLDTTPFFGVPGVKPKVYGDWGQVVRDLQLLHCPRCFLLRNSRKIKHGGKSSIYRWFFPVKLSFVRHFPFFQAWVPARVVARVVGTASGAARYSVMELRKILQQESFRAIRVWSSQITTEFFSGDPKKNTARFQSESVWWQKDN